MSPDRTSLDQLAIYSCKVVLDIVIYFFLFADWVKEGFCRVKQMKRGDK